MATAAELQADLTLKTEQLGYANATYSKLLQRVQRKYRLDTGATSEQEADMQRLKDLRQEIEWLQGQINWLNMQLDGGGVNQLHSTRWG